MIRILICDDDVKFCEFISHLVTKSLELELIEYELNVTESATDIADSTLFDLCFLDIDMPYNGINLACHIKKRNKNSMIIFISAKTELILNSFEAHPYDFFPKTLTAHELEKKINCVISQFKPLYYHFSYKGIETDINLLDIYLIEKFNNDLYIKTEHHSYHQRKKLSVVLEELNSQCNFFVQISKSSIINLKKIEDMSTNSFILNNGLIVNSTKTYIAHAKRKYLEMI